MQLLPETVNNLKHDIDQIKDWIRNEKKGRIKQNFARFWKILKGLIRENQLKEVMFQIFQKATSYRKDTKALSQAQNNYREILLSQKKKSPPPELSKLEITPGKTSLFPQNKIHFGAASLMPSHSRKRADTLTNASQLLKSNQKIILQPLIFYDTSSQLSFRSTLYSQKKTDSSFKTN